MHLIERGLTMERNKMYAVITGASSGLGEQFARQLAAEGYSIILVARREDRLKKLKALLEKSYLVPKARCLYLTADLGDMDGCARLVAYLEKKPVMIFINNAGFGDCGYFPETDLDKDMNMIDVNVKAVHYLTKEMVRKMSAQKNGYLLNVASSAGLLPAGPYMATYYATKAYVASMSQAVARELEENKSRVYVGALCPGPVDTEFNSVANVEFALKGITPKYCVEYAIEGMKKRQTVIVPTLTLKAGTTAGRFLPRKLAVAITSHQQKKKLYR